MPANECVETALTDPAAPAVGIRDSKDPGGSVINLAAGDWRVLIQQIKHGHHDLC